MVATFSPAEFWAIVDIGIRAGQARAPAVLRRPRDAAAAASPYLKAASALREHFGDDGARFESAMARFAALMALFSDHKLQQWVRASPENPLSSDIHPAVIDVAARMKPSRNGKFPVRKFLREVEQTARRRYAGLEEWPQRGGADAS